MILLAAALLAGDAWSWNVSLRYDDADGMLLDNRERWTVRVGPDSSLTAERHFLRTVLQDGVAIDAPETPTETLKGRVEADGTLSVKGAWSDPIATRMLRRLLAFDRKRDEVLPVWPVVRHTTMRDASIQLPGSDLPGSVRMDATLDAARLGGKRVELAPSPTSAP